MDAVREARRGGLLAQAVLVAAERGGAEEDEVGRGQLGHRRDQLLAAAVGRGRALVEDERLALDPEPGPQRASRRRGGRQLGDVADNRGPRGQPV